MVAISLPSDPPVVTFRPSGIFFENTLKGHIFRLRCVRRDMRMWGLCCRGRMGVRRAFVAGFSLDLQACCAALRFSPHHATLHCYCASYIHGDKRQKLLSYVTCTDRTLINNYNLRRKHGIASAQRFLNRR